MKRKHFLYGLLAGAASTLMLVLFLGAADPTWLDIASSLKRIAHSLEMISGQRPGWKIPYAGK
jgi:hypothetical protein